MLAPMSQGSLEPEPRHENRFGRRPVATMAVVWCAILAGVVVVLEAAYRYQVVDFYGRELRALNSPRDLEDDGRSVVLALGDSFTASPRGFVSLLRARLSTRARVVNGGVSGFSARQILRVAPARVRRFAPRVVILQLYVGNDLIETLHPISWSRAGGARSAYWLVEDAGLESAGFLNYRAGQLLDALRRRLGQGSISHAELARLEALPFDPRRYTARERILLAADPGGIEAALQLTGRAARACALYERDLRTVIETAVTGGSRVLVVPVPHEVQVAAHYRTELEAVGAIFSPGFSPARGVAFDAALARLVGDYPGVDLCDPLPALRAAEASGSRLYRNDDPHLNDTGQLILGECVLDALLRLDPALRPTTR